MSDHLHVLCQRAKEGDSDAASELVTLTYERIYAGLRRRCSNDADAADLTQKTFVKAWRSLPTFENRSSITTWLQGIAHHVYVDWMRQARPLQSATEPWWEACPSETTGPFEDASERDLARHVYSCVERLEETGREIVHLHYYQGLSIRETSEILGIATSTAKYRLRAALEALRVKAVEPLSSKNL